MQFMLVLCQAVHSTIIETTQDWTTFLASRGLAGRPSAAVATEHATRLLRLCKNMNLCQHPDAVGFKHHLLCHGTAVRVVVAEPCYVPEFHTYENVVWKRRPLHVTRSARA